MEIVAYMVGTLGFVFSLSALGKISRLEKALAEAGVLPRPDREDDQA